MYRPRKWSQPCMHILFKIVGVIFLLFIIMFVAIVIEETFLGGRRRRMLERKVRKPPE